MISVYSVCCSVVFFNISLIGVFILRRKTRFLAKYAASSLIFFTVLGLVHLVVPVDFAEAYVIRSKHVLPAIQGFLAFKLFGSSITVSTVILFVWACGSIAFAVRDIAIGLRARQIRAHYVYVEDEQVSRIASDFGCKYIVKVSPDVSVPHMAGLFHPVIYLPCLELSDDELRFVLLHEIEHIRSCDTFKKFLFLMIEALFWWNPIAHISISEIDALLELHCDARVTADLDEVGKLNYMQAILSAAKQNLRTREPAGPYSLAFSKGTSQIKQRFEVLLCRERRSSKRACILLNCAFLAAFIMSYMVIVQPYYPPPANEIYGVYEFTPESSYILLQDGKYKLYCNGSCIGELSENELDNVPYSRLELIEG